MSRKRTGLRNRYRARGRSTYARLQKRIKGQVYDRPMIDHPDHPGGAKYICCAKKEK